MNGNSEASSLVQQYARRDGPYSVDGRNGEVDAAGDADNHVMALGSTPQMGEKFSNSERTNRVMPSALGQSPFCTRGTKCCRD
jgi:hypothetical protein